MNVLHVMWAGTVGGAERALYQLVRAQRQFSSFKPVVGYCQPHGYYADLLRSEGVEVVSLGLRRGRDLHRLHAAKSMMSRFPIHHFHAVELVPMLASACCRRATRIYSHRAGASKYPFLKSLQYRSAGLLCRFRFHGFSGNTRRACFSGPRVMGLSPDGWHVTYNGLDFSLLAPRAAMDMVARRHGIVLDGSPIIGTSANLRSLKRIDFLLRACADCQKQLFRILIVGDGPDRERLERLTDSLGLRDRTIFAGTQNHVPDYLALMDIFVLPSNSEESFGNSVVEAMAVGLPSLVFRDGGGLPEHIEHEHTGYVVNSVQDLAERLSALINSPALRHRIGMAARAAVYEKYTLEAMVRRYDQLYNAALCRSRSEQMNQDLIGDRIEAR